MGAHSKLLLFLRATFTRTYNPPCPLLLLLSSFSFFFFSLSPFYLSVVRRTLLPSETLWVSYLIYRSFCLDMTAGLRGREKVCVRAHTYYVWETLMVFHVWGRLEKKKKAINRNSQRKRQGEGEALMSRWRRISVFHVERWEGRGNVPTNKINVKHKQAKKRLIMRRLPRDESAVKLRGIRVRGGGECF